MLHVLGTLEVSGVDYSQPNIKLKRLAQPTEYGIDATRFYGGKLHWIGETDSDVLVLLDRNNRAFDTAAVNLKSIPMQILRQVATRKKIEFDNRTPKKHLIALLNGDPIEEEPDSEESTEE